MGTHSNLNLDRLLTFHCGGVFSWRRGHDSLICRSWTLRSFLQCQKCPQRRPSTIYRSSWVFLTRRARIGQGHGDTHTGGFHSQARADATSSLWSRQIRENTCSHSGVEGMVCENIHYSEYPK